MVATDIGADPFHNKTFCETFRIINKKTYFLSTDHATSLELKDTKYRRMKKNQWQGMSLLKGWSYGYLIIVRGVPNGVGNTDTLNLSYNYRRKYCVNKIEDSTDKSGEN